MRARRLLRANQTVALGMAVMAVGVTAGTWVAQPWLPDLSAGQ